MLKWTFGANTGPFRQGLNEMRSETKKFSGSVKGMLAGALGVGAIIAGFRSLFAEMDRVQKLGLRFGESAETIQKVSLAAKLAGSDVEGLAKGLTVATRNAMEAATGSETMADAFDRAGIEAASFVNLPMEEKILALAGALEQGKGSGENLAMMMEILGRSGADLIPLLAQGQKELQEQFEKTATVSQETVDAIANFNDQLDILKQRAQVGGGMVISVFMMMIETLAVGASFSIGVISNTFGTLVDVATAAGEVIGKSLSGDFKGAAEASKKFKQIASNSLNTLKNEATAAAEGMGEAYESIFNPPEKKENGLSQKIKDAAEAVKIEKERQKLSKEIADMEEAARQRALSLEEKITEAMKKRLVYAQLAANGGDSKAGLESRKKELEIAKELEGLRKQQEQEKERTLKDAESKTKEMNDLAAREKEVDRSNAMAGMDDKQKREFLQGEKDRFDAEAIDPFSSDLERGEARISSKERQGEIDGINRSEVSSSLSDLNP